MEQDFMGLRTAKVKTEASEEPTDSASVRGTMMRWSFSNRNPANSQFFSFDGAGAGAVPVLAAKDDKHKTGFEALASTGLVTITTTETLDSAQKSFSAVMQKNTALDNQGGTHYTVTSYPGKPFDVQSLHRPHEARVHPLTSPANQTVSMTMTNPVHHSFLSSAGPNLIGSTTPPPLSVPSSVPLVHSSPLVGTTELRGISNPPGTPAQLTIFYAGSVCVYDDISPEKAQAIMLLAGNAPPMASIPAIPAVPVQSVQPPPPVPIQSIQPIPAVPVQSVQPVSAVQASVVRPSFVDSFIVNQSHSSKPCIPSPISLTCHSPSASMVATDATPLRAIRSLAPANKGEPPKQANTLVSAPTKLVPSAAVPQFRKASLARFLEKRKERTLSSSPYAADKQSQDCGSPASGSRSMSVNSSSSSALPAMN